MNFRKYFKEIVKNFKIKEAFIVLLIAGLSVVMVKYFSRKAGVWQTIRVEVVGSGWENNSYQSVKPPFWLSEKIKINDIERGVDGSEIAEVLRVENYERDDEKTDVYLIMKVKTEFNGKMKKHVFKGRAIEVGSMVELRLSSVLVRAQIIDDQVPEEGYKQKQVIVQGRWLNQEFWSVNQIRVGDTMTNRGNNQVVAEVLSVWSEPATINLSRIGQLSITSGSRRVDGLIKFKILLVKYGDEWYFAGHQKVKVGRDIGIYLPDVDMPYVEIMAIDPVN